MIIIVSKPLATFRFKYIRCAVQKLPYLLEREVFIYSNEVWNCNLLGCRIHRFQCYCWIAPASLRSLHGSNPKWICPESLSQTLSVSQCLQSNWTRASHSPQVKTKPHSEQLYRGVGTDFMPISHLGAVINEYLLLFILETHCAHILLMLGSSWIIFVYCYYTNAKLYAYWFLFTYNRLYLENYSFSQQAVTFWGLPYSHISHRLYADIESLVLGKNRCSPHTS